MSKMIRAVLVGAYVVQMNILLHRVRGVWIFAMSLILDMQNMIKYTYLFNICASGITI